MNFARGGHSTGYEGLSPAELAYGPARYDPYWSV
jgi:hypothetical protein